MTIDVQLTDDDYVEAAQAVAAPTRRGLALLAIFVAIAVVTAAFFWLTKRPGAAGGVVGGIAGGGLGGWLTRRRSIARKARLVFQQHKALHRPYRITVTDEAINLTSENGDSTIAWTDFHRWQDLERQFLLLLSDVSFLMIPKRSFDGPEQTAEFRELLARRIGAPA